MKILIFGFTKLAYMPYAHFYFEALLEGGHELHLLTWNRENIKDIAVPDGVILHEFCRCLLDEQPKYKKIPAFFMYRRALVRLIKKERFDFLIVLHTLPGVLIHRRLNKEFKKRYILDYRDYTFESVGMFSRIIGRMVSGAALTFVSSDAFRKFLPELPRILTSHNLPPEAAVPGTAGLFNAGRLPIRLSFWGFIRHERINRALIDRLKGDSRFELYFYGREQETAAGLKAYCTENGVSNVFFRGAYKPGDRLYFAKETEIIHNLYDGGGTEELAVGNKFYDGLLFCRPQVVMPGSAMARLVAEAGVGIALDPYKEDFADRLYAYYTSLEPVVFGKACGDKLQEALNEYNSGIQAVKDAVNDKGENHVNI